MRIEVERDVFAGSLKKASGACGGKVDIPILTNARMRTDGERTLMLESTDLQLSLRTAIEAKVIEEGMCTVPAKLAYDIVKSLPGRTVSVACGPDGAVIESGSAVFKLPTLPVEDFPHLSALDTTSDFVECDRTGLLVALSNVFYVIPSQSDPFSIPGVFWHQVGEKFRMIATDGHRLAWSDQTPRAVGGLDVGDGITVPHRGVVELMKLLEAKELVMIAMDGNRLLAKAGGTTLAVELLDGDFPDYEVIVPEDRPMSAVFDVDDLKQCLKRCEVISSIPSQAVQLHFGGEEVVLLVNSSDRGTCENRMPVESNGEGSSLAMSLRYLSQMVSNFSGGKIRLEWLDKMHAYCFVNPVSPGGFHLIMGMVV